MPRKPKLENIIKSFTKSANQLIEEMKENSSSEIQLEIGLLAAQIAACGKDINNKSLLHNYRWREMTLSCHPILQNMISSYYSHKTNHGVDHPSRPSGEDKSMMINKSYLSIDEIKDNQPLGMVDKCFHIVNNKDIKFSETKYNIYKSNGSYIVGGLFLHGGILNVIYFIPHDSKAKEYIYNKILETGEKYIENNFKGYDSYTFTYGEIKDLGLQIKIV